MFTDQLLSQNWTIEYFYPVMYKLKIRTKTQAVYHKIPCGIRLIIVPLLILRHRSKHWPCLPRKRGGAFTSHKFLLAQKYDGITMICDAMKKAEEHQREMVFCCCWHSLANRRLAHSAGTHVDARHAELRLREESKDYERDFGVLFMRNVLCVYEWLDSVIATHRLIMQLRR